MMGIAAVGIFLGHSLLMLVDEFHFHRRRGLPRWERWGHPLDTLSVIACYAFALFMPFSPGAAAAYILLALFSCLWITKDEWVHAELCGPGEQWVHSVLFVLHPVLLGLAGWYWVVSRTSPTSHAEAIFTEPGIFAVFFPVHAAITFLFLIYQIIWWNILCRQKPEPIPSKRKVPASKPREISARLEKAEAVAAP